MKLTTLAKLNGEFLVLVASTALLTIGSAWIYPPLGFVVPGVVGLMDVLLGKLAQVSAKPSEGIET